MKRILSIVLVLFILFSTVACDIIGGNNGGSDNGGNSGDNNGTNNGTNSGGSNGGGSNNGGSNSGSAGNGGSTGSDEKPSPDYPADELAAFEALFDPNNHISLKLDISDSELKKIQQDHEKYSSFGSKSPIYRMADLIVTITYPDGSSDRWVIEQVGVRMKGNTSRTDFYSDSDGMYNLVHFKISFQETFDDESYYGRDALVWNDSSARKARKKRTFATLEKIDIRWNRNDDTTYIRENYAYELYREFGVLAPHTNLASVDIGNDHAGVWVVYEPVDDVFLEKNLPASALGGDLYKLGWTYEGATFTFFSSYGVEDEDNGMFYIYDLKTNKKTSTHESLKNLINTLKSNGATKASLESVIDIENFINYCAVSYYIGNPDDLRNNYNNSYIYFRADTGKMIIIPYDMDRGFGVNTWNPTGHGMTKDDPFTKQALGNNSDQRSPLFLKTVCRGGLFVNEYTEALKAVDASDMLKTESFKAAFDTAAALYSGEATPSKGYYNTDGYKFRFDINRTCNPDQSKNMSFADYISAKRETLYKAIGDQGNTEKPSDNSGSTDNGENSGNNGSTGGDGGNQGGTGSDVLPDRDPISNCNPYFMSDLNNWEVKSRYKLTDNGGGIFTIEISSRNGFKFKIRDNNSGLWYGSEVLDPNCEVWNAPDKHTNIYLDSGSYTVTFDANTATIYIEKH